jgi:hypothetical protein
VANIYTNSKVDLTSTAETVVYTSPAAGTSTTATTSIIKSLPNTDTVYEDVTRSVKIKVADMPPLGAGSDE